MREGALMEPRERAAVDRGLPDDFGKTAMAPRGLVRKELGH